MDASTSSSTPRAYIRDPGKLLGRFLDKDKSDDKLKISAHRSTRYKEKFQALREKYDQVNSKHEEYQRDLDTANKRIKKLQAENDLLLDAMNLAVPTRDAVVQHITAPQQHYEPRRHPSPHLGYTNGTTNGIGKNIGAPRRSSEVDTLVSGGRTWADQYIVA